MDRAPERTLVQGIEDWANWLAYLLFEPSPAIFGVVERRRTRLLSKLQAVFALDCLLGAVQGHLNETGPVQRSLPVVLGFGTLMSLVCYAISRTRHARVSIWILVAVFDVICPAGIIGAGPVAPAHVLINLVMMVQAVLLVSAMSSARATWLTGGVALAIAIALKASLGSYEWGVPFRQAMVFMVSSVALIVVLGVHRGNVEADRASELRHRNEELEALRQTLEEKVVERTAELHSRNADMRRVLDNVLDGIFTVDRSGVMASEQSAMLNRWFGPHPSGQTLCRYFSEFAPEFGAALANNWAQIVDDLLPVELALAQLPSAFVHRGHHYHVAYEATSTEGPDRFLVVVSDVTSEVEREASQHDRQESLNIFEHAIENRAALLDFVAEGSELVLRAFGDHIKLVERKRALHTLKGNAGLFGLSRFAELCHHAETVLESAGNGQAAADQVSASWARFSKQVAGMLGAQSRLIEVDPELLEQLARASASAPRAELARSLRELAFEPAERRLQQFAEQVRRLAERLDKKTAIRVQHDDLRLDGRIWSPVWAATVHALRNAVDHGLEFPAERLAAGKSEEGHVMLSARRVNGSVVLEIEDDGRGIDWERVRERCLAVGMKASSREDLVQGLFADGVSTATTVTDLSGRGVGMGALLAAAQALGGKVDIRSERGRGTLLQVVVPAA